MNSTRLFCQKLTKTDRPSVQLPKERDDPSNRYMLTGNTATDSTEVNRTIKRIL